MNSPPDRFQFFMCGHLLWRGKKINLPILGNKTLNTSKLWIKGNSLCQRSRLGRRPFPIWWEPLFPGTCLHYSWNLSLKRNMVQFLSVNLFHDKLTCVILKKKKRAECTNLGLERTANWLLPGEKELFTLTGMVMGSSANKRAHSAPFHKENCWLCGLSCLEY